MSFRLETSEPLVAGLQRLAREQIGDCLSEGKDGKSASIRLHEARKALKRTRALLRLVRHGLGRKVWRRENDALRDIARSLGAARDSDVLPNTIALARDGASRPAADALDRLRAHLDEVRETKPIPDPGRALAAAARDLTAARRRLSRLEFKSSRTGEEVLHRGLAMTHERGRHALDKARSGSLDDEEFHDLRKAVQAHWRQMQLLAAAWPEVLIGRARTARRLAQALGEYQDLAVLARTASEAAKAGLGQPDAERVIARCRELQKAIRAKTMPEVGRLFASEPEDFAGEIVRCWKLAEELRLASASNGREKPPRKLASHAPDKTPETGELVTAEPPAQSPRDEPAPHRTST